MRTMLVIDDEPLILDCFRYLFPPSEVKLLTATTASEGMRLFSEHRPDVVIVDIRLPDMTGYELLLKLQEIMDPVPLVLMTGFGYDPGHSIVKARQARLPLYGELCKPFRLDQLLDTVERIVRPRAEQEASLAGDAGPLESLPVEQQ